jgi:hypothetical protein
VPGVRRPSGTERLACFRVSGPVCLGPVTALASRVSFLDVAPVADAPQLRVEYAAEPGALQGLSARLGEPAQLRAVGSHLFFSWVQQALQAQERTRVREPQPVEGGSVPG